MLKDSIVVHALSVRLPPPVTDEIRTCAVPKRVTANSPMSMETSDLTFVSDVSCVMVSGIAMFSRSKSFTVSELVHVFPVQGHWGRRCF